MRILEDRKLIYLAYPRSASRSTRSVLDNYSNLDNRDIGVEPHATYIDIKEHLGSAGRDIKDYTVFTVLRHPVSRLLSYYNSPKGIWKKRADEAGDFKTFIFSDYISNECYRDWDPKINKEDRDRLFDDIVMMNMERFSLDIDGSVGIDRILLMEDLPECLSEFLSGFDIDVNLPSKGVGSYTRDIGEYYDIDTLRRVEEVFALDIELWEENKFE